jgi:hypothetical protein
MSEKQTANRRAPRSKDKQLSIDEIDLYRLTDREWPNELVSCPGKPRFNTEGMVKTGIRLLAEIHNLLSSQQSATLSIAINALLRYAVDQLRNQGKYIVVSAASQESQKLDNDEADYTVKKMIEASSVLVVTAGYLSLNASSLKVCNFNLPDDVYQLLTNQPAPSVTVINALLKYAIDDLNKNSKKIVVPSPK